MKPLWLCKIQFPYDEAIRERVKEIPGVIWGPHYGYLPSFYAPVEAKPDLDALECGVQMSVPQLVQPEVVVPQDLPLRPFQVETVTETLRHLNSEGRWLIADEQGLGKTIEAIAALKSYERVLLVVPAAVKRNWQRELKRWINRTAFVVTFGDSKTVSKKRRTAQENALQGHHSIITSYGTFATLLKNGKLPTVNLVVFDEIHKCKRPDAPWSKAVQQYLAAHPQAKALGMTGTTIANLVDDVWGITHILWPNRLGRILQNGKYSFQFNNFYMDGFETAYGWDWSKGLRAERAESLHARLKCLMSRHTKHDVKEQLPSVISRRLYIDVDTKFKKSLTDLVGKDVKEGFEALLFRSSPRKVEFACEWLEEKRAEGASHVLIFTYLKATAAAISAAIPGSILVTGDLDADARDKVLEKARTLEISVVVATMHSVGLGINSLADYDHTLFAELYWDPITLQQAVARVNRLDSKADAAVDWAILAGTAEERIANVVLKKLEDIDKALGADVSGQAVTKGLDSRKGSEELLAELANAFNEDGDFDLTDD